MNLQGPYTTNYVLQQAQNHPALAGVLIDEDCPDEDEDPSAQRTALPHIAVAFGAGLLLPADGLDMSRYQRQIEDFSAQLQQQGWRQQQYSEQQQVQFWRRVSELQALKASDVLAQRTLPPRALSADEVTKKFVDLQGGDRTPSLEQLADVVASAAVAHMFGGDLFKPTAPTSSGFVCHLIQALREQGGRVCEFGLQHAARVLLQQLLAYDHEAADGGSTQPLGLVVVQRDDGSSTVVVRAAQQGSSSNAQAFGRQFRQQVHQELLQFVGDFVCPLGRTKWFWEFWGLLLEHWLLNLLGIYQGVSCNDFDAVVCKGSPPADSSSSSSNSNSSGGAALFTRRSEHAVPTHTVQVRSSATLVLLYGVLWYLVGAKWLLRQKRFGLGGVVVLLLVAPGARCQVVVFEERAVLRVMSANGAWALQTVYGFESHFYVMANPSPAQLEADQRDGMWRVDLDGAQDIQQRICAALSNAIAPSAAGDGSAPTPATAGPSAAPASVQEPAAAAMVTTGGRNLPGAGVQAAAGGSSAALPSMMQGVTTWAAPPPPAAATVAPPRRRARPALTQLAAGASSYPAAAVTTPAALLLLPPPTTTAAPQPNMPSAAAALNTTASGPSGDDSVTVAAAGLSVPFTRVQEAAAAAAAGPASPCAPPSPSTAPAAAAASTAPVDLLSVFEVADSLDFDTDVDLMYQDYVDSLQGVDMELDTDTQQAATEWAALVVFVGGAPATPAATAAAAAGNAPAERRDSPGAAPSLQPAQAAAAAAAGADSAPNYPSQQLLNDVARLFDRVDWHHRNKQWRVRSGPAYQGVFTDLRTAAHADSLRPNTVEGLVNMCFLAPEQEQAQEQELLRQLRHRRQQREQVCIDAAAAAARAATAAAAARAARR